MVRANAAYHLLHILLFVHLWTCIAAQPFVLRIYTANHGLPDANTLSIYQDQQGYLWIGSYTGLSRFDGQRFETVDVKTMPPALNPRIVLQDHLGRLWISYKQSLCILERDTILTFPTDDGRPMQYVFGAVQLQDKRIWALVDQGAYAFEEKKWKKIVFPQPYEGLNCRQVIETPEGLYFNFEKYIAFQNKQGEFISISPDAQDAFYINMQRSGNSIYANRVNGMIKIENGIVTELFADQLSQTTNYNFIIDQQKRFWISTEKYGILASKPGNETYLDYTISLPFNLSPFLFEDREHHIWATNYEGLIKISEVDFNRFDFNSGEEYENIRCLATNPQGQLYFASSGHGVYTIPPGSSQPVALRFSSLSDFAQEVVDGMSFDDTGALWLITRGQRLIRYQHQMAEDLSSKVPPNDQGYYALLYHKSLQKMLIAADKLYIGDSRGFISWGEYFHTAEIIQPRFFCPRRDGSFFINTMTDGIVLIDAQYQRIPVSDQLGILESSREIRIYEDPVNGVWITNTGSGISHFTEKKKNVFEKSTVITTKEGLPSNTIISAVFDRQNTLWLTTLAGIATVTRIGGTQDKMYKVNRVGEELGSTVLNWGASGLNIACDQDDHIWVSTFHELIRFEPDQVHAIRNPPGISIEDIRLNLKETDWKKYSDSCTGYFDIPFSPVLHHTENALGIRYRGISFSENPGLNYSYLLSRVSTHALPDSLDAGWSEPTVSDDVSFVNLPSGQYRFAVRAREAGSPWSQPATFFFVIQPPFWGTWWFRLLAVLFMVALIWGGMRFRIQQIQQKSDVQNQLHDLEMKALKAQMNPHFIYNALNSIQSLVMDGKQQEAVKYMSKFARLLREVLEHSGANLVTLDKELHTIDLYVQLEMLRMNVKLDYVVELDEQILAEKEWVPPLILQPFVENALWHGLSRKTGEKRLRIGIHADDEWLYVTITDNGIGRQKAEEVKSGNLDYPRSMGMEITGKRLQVVNAENVAAINIMDMQDADGHPAGTQVGIRLKRQNRIPATASFIF